MNLLGISCSPRAGGNTEIMLKEALKPAVEAGWQTGLFYLSEKKVAPCDACGTCHKTGLCIINDDMQELYRLMQVADAIIFASPVYFGCVSAQAKAVMDRTYATFFNRSLKDKVAGAIVVTRRVGAIQAQSSLFSFCIAHEMIVAGGAIGYGRKRGDVLEGIGGGINSTALGEARALGMKIVRMRQRII